MELKGMGHHLFWMGDLNYRVDWGEQRGNAPTQQDFNDMVIFPPLPTHLYPSVLGQCGQSLAVAPVA